mmetsp:Transcript_23932/g.50427  ORF Transcript_23932/g.50427 Transcript_23932/m.50427 type:complete len:214 (+) Transcript_23932:3112-3753(+)
MQSRTGDRNEVCPLFGDCVEGVICVEFHFQFGCRFHCLLHSSNFNTPSLQKFLQIWNCNRAIFILGVRITICRRNVLSDGSQFDHKWILFSGLHEMIQSAISTPTTIPVFASSTNEAGGKVEPKMSVILFTGFLTLPIVWIRTNFHPIIHKGQIFRVFTDRLRLIVQLPRLQILLHRQTCMMNDGIGTSRNRHGKIMFRLLIVGKFRDDTGRF